tara:strand:- start:554 stop:730 length:177 start_codon:yes stop_codon:yes gene_type:complete
MRATEYIDYLTRTNVGLGKNIKEHEYTHLTITQKLKRERYNYQKELRRKANDEKYGSF